MDDLIIYLIALLTNDPTLLAIWQAASPAPVAGAAPVTVLVYNPEVRAETSYPRITIYGDDGVMRFSGDKDPTWFDGRVHIAIYTRISDSNPNALATLTQIKQRVTVLLLGSPATPETRGQAVGDYYVSDFQQTAPSARVPKMNDPTVRKQILTYKTTLHRNLYTEGAAIVVE